MLWLQRSSRFWSLPRIFTPRHAFRPRTASSVPSFSQHVARASDVKQFSDEIKYPSVKNQVLFTVYASFVIYFVAARVANEKTYELSNRLEIRQQGTGAALGPAIPRAPSNEEMRRVRYFEFGKKLQTTLASLTESLKDAPQTVRGLATWVFVQVAQPTLDASEGRRVCWAIGAANVLAWVAWQMPRLRPLMARNFAHHPLSGQSYTLLTSIFSHKSLWHLVASCAVLPAFGATVSNLLIRQQAKNSDNLREATVQPHLTALFLTAGLFSGLVSHVATARLIYPRLISRLAREAAAKATSAGAAAGSAASAAKTTTIPSFFGSSGAIYALIMMTALEHPETGLAWHMPPTFPLPILWGVGGLLAVDVLGILRGWRMFNHWGHLGGAAFGAFYHRYGPRIWEWFREESLWNLPRSLIRRREPDADSPEDASSEIV